MTLTHDCCHVKYAYLFAVFRAEQEDTQGTTMQTGCGIQSRFAVGAQLVTKTMLCIAGAIA